MVQEIMEMDNGTTLVEYLLPTPDILRYVGIDEDTFWLICELNNEFENMKIELKARGEINAST